MWLRLRVENLPIDLDWWVTNITAGNALQLVLRRLECLYLVLALAGLCLRPRLWVPMLAYLLLRGPVGDNEAL
jgi:hypothetical protein